MLNHLSGLYTDLYELTMAQGYFYSGRKDERAVFDYFFRTNPFDRGFVVFAGLGDLLSILENNFTYSKEDVEYLRSKGFHQEFLEYLSDFSFQGSIHSAKEGEIVFPNEPVLRVEGNLIESQIVESCLLNFLNFESLIATKSARIQMIAGDRVFTDFGLRRAHGLGAIQAARAAVIGGASSTSNVLAGFLYDLEITGTQAHSWIQSFDSELEAFRKFAEFYPDDSILLVDTYDTIKSGIPNAIKVARELEKKGHKLLGIRLDSGDLAYLSKKARQMLDKEALDYVQIIASNQLDEYIIRSLIDQGAPIDGFGIGTRLITGQPDARMDGVYKLSMTNEIPRLKISEQPEKISLPGRKKIIRYCNDEGLFVGDAICLDQEVHVEKMIHPHQPDKHTILKGLEKENLLSQVMNKGKICTDNQSPGEINQYVMTRLKNLPEEHKRFENPHVYKVGVSEELIHLRDKIVDDIRANM